MNEEFICAALENKFELVKSLLTDKSVDPTFANNFAIRTADTKCFFKIVELLLSDDRVHALIPGISSSVHSLPNYQRLTEARAFLRRNNTTLHNVDMAIEDISRHRFYPILSLLRDNRMQNYKNFAWQSFGVFYMAGASRDTGSSVSHFPKEILFEIVRKSYEASKNTVLNRMTSP